VIAAQRRVYARHAETIAQVEADHAELLTNIAELRERIAELQSEFEESAQPVFDAVEADLPLSCPALTTTGGRSRRTASKMMIRFTTPAVTTSSSLRAIASTRVSPKTRALNFTT
jgi:hypothetical protein